MCRREGECRANACTHIEEGESAQVHVSAQHDSVNRHILGELVST